MSKSNCGDNELNGEWNLSMITRLTLLIVCGLLLGCTSSPTNRRQVVLYSDADMAAQGEQAYRQMQQQMPVSTNSRQVDYVRCVANYVVAALDETERGNIEWEVTVFDDLQANAFALPGGKIGVYNGLLDVAVNQHQLAAVMAHEVGHVLASHSNERASQSALRNVGVAAARILGASDTTLEAIDLGTQLGLFLPFNRTQESEADVIGLYLMAEAGFDPRQSITLWQNMSATGGPRQPEFLSTHPSPSSRIEELASRMDEATGLQQTAIAQGINPDCTPPARNF
jgi:predicted Zn-dependent protease